MNRVLFKQSNKKNSFFSFEGWSRIVPLKIAPTKRGKRLSN